MVTFKNGFFTSIEGVYFKTGDDFDDPLMVMPLGSGEVSLKFRGIKKDLELDHDGPDFKMLDTVAQALKFVRGLKIGDPLPSEILTGRASWKVNARHKKLANNRVTLQLICWLSGDQAESMDAEQVEAMISDPATKAKINDAFGAMTKALGLDADSVDEAVAMVGNLANELSYIECLRDSYHMIRAIFHKITDLEKIYSHDMTTVETIRQVMRLYRTALHGFKEEFENLDAQTGEILSVLRNIGPQTKYIRDTRDGLHRRLWAWDDIIEDWRPVKIVRSKNTEALLKELYPFLAQRYLQAQEWGSFFKAQMKIQAGSTEKRW